MRILTVRQPYAWAIIHGGKDVENRVRNIAGSYRGPVAIHVSKTDADGLDIDDPMYGLIYAGCEDRHRPVDHNSWKCKWCTEVEPRRFRDQGHIIGVVDIVDVHVSHEAVDQGRAICVGRETDIDGVCSPWAEPFAHHMVLEKPRALATPIPYKGSLGLRELDADTEALIWEQVTS